MNPKAPYAECDGCPLRDQPCVPSYIPRNARILVIGEAPGREEVQHGRPFIGRSGQLLDRVAEFAGINPGEIGRTNAVLCRPEANATPPASAVAACAKRLAHDVNTSGAGILVPMGGTALAAVDALSLKTSGNGGTITSRRGRWYNVAHYRVMPTYHPAYVLRQPGFINQLRSDFGKAVAAVNTSGGRKPFNTADVKYIPCNASNRHRVIEHLNHMPAGAVLAFDVESDDLQWYDTPARYAGPLLELGLAWQPNRVVVIPADELIGELLAAVQAAFNRGKPVAHNGKFDQHVLARQAGIFLTLAYDTMLAHYALDETKGTHDLKQLTADVLDCDDDYEKRLVIDWFNQNRIKKEDRKYGMLPAANRQEYLAIDVAATLALWPRLQTELETHNLYEWPFKKVLMPVANAIEAVEQNGIKVDVPYLHTVGAYIDAEKSKLLGPMREMVAARVKAWLEAGNIVVPRADWIKDRDTYAKCIQRLRDDFNPNSWQQVQVFLYDVLKLQHTKQLGYKTDARSTAEEALLSVHPNDESGFVDALLAHRRLEKIRGTYVDKLLSMADVQDRVHINYLIHGTEIGRLSATDALHGIPRPGDVNPLTGEADIYGDAIRGAFIAADGCTLVIADYSQAELRAFAAESREPTMIEPYNNGEDLHDATAVMIEAGLAEYFNHHFWYDHNGDWAATKNCPVCKNIRTTAKNVNFGEVYQGGAYGIWSMLGGRIPLKYVAQVLKIKRERQKVAAAWKDEQFRLARSQGFVQTRFGRMRRFPLITDENIDEVKKACVHFKIASGASDLTLLSIASLVASGVKVCGTWHDSIIAESKIEHANAVADLMQHTMVSTAERWYPEVAWKVDVDVQPRWYMKIPDLSVQ